MGQGRHFQMYRYPVSTSLHLCGRIWSRSVARDFVLPDNGQAAIDPELQTTNSDTSLPPLGCDFGSTVSPDGLPHSASQTLISPIRRRLRLLVPAGPQRCPVTVADVLATRAAPMLIRTPRRRHKHTPNRQVASISRAACPLPRGRVRAFPASAALPLEAAGPSQGRRRMVVRDDILRARGLSDSSRDAPSPAGRSRDHVARWRGPRALSDC